MTSSVKSWPTMWSTRVKRARRLGAAGHVLARAASAVPKSGHGLSSAVTRSMSAGAFPPTSWRSTKPRTSTGALVRVRAPEFAGYSGLPEVSMSPADRSRHLRRRRGRPDRTVGPEGGLTVRRPTVRLLAGTGQHEAGLRRRAVRLRRTRRVTGNTGLIYEV